MTENTVEQLSSRTGAWLERNRQEYKHPDEDSMAPKKQLPPKP